MLERGIKETVEIPEDIDVTVDGNLVVVAGNNAELSKNFDFQGVSLEKVDSEIIVKSETSKRDHKAAVGTVLSHIRNLMKGAVEDYVSKLKVVYSHFPITVEVKGRKVEIQNFVGEEKPRYANIVGDTEVEIKGQDILVRGPDKENVGQTAANIEQVSLVRGRDPRVFQDGIYIVERP